MATPENPPDAALGGDAAGDDAEAAPAAGGLAGGEPRVKRHRSLIQG